MQSKHARRYHTKNVISEGQQVWEFEVQTLAGTSNIVTILLLGKVPQSNKAALLEILKNVSIIQNRPEWRCRHWAWDAIDHLVANGVVTLPDGLNAEQVWENGYNFAQSVDTEDLPHQDMPTCDMFGNAIDSEVGSWLTKEGHN